MLVKLVVDNEGSFVNLVLQVMSLHVNKFSKLTSNLDGWRGTKRAIDPIGGKSCK
jgi:hypothetical protein